MKRRLWIPFALGAISAMIIATSGAQAGPDVAPGQTGNEPNNAVVNPRNPAQVAVAQGCQVRISNDYGQTWPIIRNTTIAVCNGDPSMAFDSQGRLFVSHLSTTPGEFSVFAGQIADTTTNGTQNYTPIRVSTVDGIADDKQWLAADTNPTSPFRDNLYLVWSQGPAIPCNFPNCSVQFSRSTNSGAAWSAPQTISANGEGFVWPSHVAVAQNGDVYVSYHTQTCGAANGGTMPLIRDGSGGANLAAGTIPQKNNAFGAGQATISCNVQDASGDEIPGSQSWLQGASQPWILPDPSNADNVYVVANDDPNNAHGNGDDADVVIARSSDFGVSFTTDRVDHGPGQSFAIMPTAAIDQDGNIAVHWYDNRRGLRNTGANSNNGAGNFLLDLYGTTSRNGGASFANDFRVADSPFDPDASTVCRFGSLAGNNCTARIGEYNGVASVDGIGYATWTGNTTPPVAPFPADGSGAQRTMFDLFSMRGAFPDGLEPNESRDSAVAALLGANNTYVQPNLTLHTATDVDFFRVVALNTGKLDVEIEFNELIADLRVLAIDRFGTTVATGAQTTSRPGNSVERLTIPVVDGQSYYIEVLDPNAPNTFAPQSTYGLTVVNRAAPVPFGIDLVAASDSGRDNADNVTNDTTPTILLRVDETSLAGLAFSATPDATLTDDAPGWKVGLFADGTLQGFATRTSAGVYSFTYPATLTEGLNSLTARVFIVDPSDDPAIGGTAHVVGQGGESAALHVTLDTLAPAAPSTPDLQAASDSAGINDDNVTRVTTPTFVGTGEPNALVRLFTDDGSGPTLNGQGVVSAGGAYQVIVGPLDDGVYNVTATLEDLAGNTSLASVALKTTIANQVLNLPGGTASGPASGPLTVDLGANTVAGYAGIAGASGKVGILGIPTVNLAGNGQAMTVLGTAGDDNLVFAPSGPAAGRLTRGEAAQVLNLSAVSSPLTIDPLGGTDTLTVNGTTGADTVNVAITTTATIQVNSLLGTSSPAATVERFGVSTGQAADTISVRVFDTVSSKVLVDGGDPAVNKPNGDTLNVIAGSAQASLKNQPGGPTPGSGSAFVSYPKTTGVETRIDYVFVEKVTLKK
jgi:Big-like domain-containing protein